MISIERKAKIKWNCRRGMLELDLILQPFIAQHLENLSLSQIKALEQLLEFSDPELYAVLLENAQVNDMELDEIVKLVRQPHHNR